MSTTPRSDTPAVRAQGPVTDAERARVAELHGKNYSRAAIARELGRSPATIGKVATDAGLSFDRSRTAVAVAAKQIDNRARRAGLIEGMYDEALSILKRLNVTEYDAVGQSTSGVTVVTRIGTIPAHDVKALAAALAQLANGASRLEAIDDGTAVDHASSLLGSLFTALQEVHGEMSADEEASR